jgi:hypothetical protein
MNSNQNETISITAITQCGLHTLRRDAKLVSDTEMNALFKSHFGASIHVVHYIWSKLVTSKLFHRRYFLKHLFWALLFLKNYSIEHVLANMVLTTRKTYRTRVRDVIIAIARLNLVSETSFFFLAESG